MNILRGKDIISAPYMSCEIAESIDEEHAGINKFTASVSARFHWIRIKETKTFAIKNLLCAKKSPDRSYPFDERCPSPPT